MKHKHAEMIKAFVEGIECESWLDYSKKWFLITSLKDFDNFDTVRIKPQPQQEQEPQYLYAYRHVDTSKIMMSPTLLRWTDEWVYMGKVEVIK